jgi:hypothetical protein
MDGIALRKRVLPEPATRLGMHAREGKSGKREDSDAT